MEGKYFYTSENSQTMNGVIYVIPQPSITIDRNQNANLTSIPYRIQSDLTDNDISNIDGCFQECYNDVYGASVTFKTLLSNCKGDWIFMGVKDITTNRYLLGSFGHMNKIFSTPYQPLQNSIWGVDISPDTIFDNGANWFRLMYTNYNNDDYGNGRNLR